MSAYEYVDGMTTADVAFAARGATLEETFIAAADATLNTMVSDLASVRPEVRRTIHVQDEQLDMLLFQVLQELVFYKDAEQLLQRLETLEIRADGSVYHAVGVLVGERIDPDRHELLIDVKAVTLHHLDVSQVADGWRATVVLDV